MFISVLEFVSLMGLFTWQSTTTLWVFYSLISLGGTPLIHHLGMEDNKKNDIAHAKNSLKIFQKKSLPMNQTRFRVRGGDDVRMMDLPGEKVLEDHIQEDFPSAPSPSPTQDQAPTNVEPEPEKPTHINQQNIAVSARLEDDVRVIDISEENHIQEELPSSSSTPHHPRSRIHE